MRTTGIESSNIALDTPDNTLEPSLGTRELPLGIVLRDLEAYQTLIHLVADESSVVETEFTYSAPLYKATDAIKEALKSGPGALEKFDIYFEHGILDEAVRVQLASAFRKRYLEQHPRSEGSDVFKASADVLQFRFGLNWPNDRDEAQGLLDKIVQHPHDSTLVAEVRKGAGVATEHLRGRFALYLDHVYNTRRRDEPAVAEVMFGSRRRNPVVIELFTNGAMPGYFLHVLEPLVDEVDGAIVWLPG